MLQVETLLIIYSFHHFTADINSYTYKLCDTNDSDFTHFETSKQYAHCTGFDYSPIFLKTQKFSVGSDLKKKVNEKCFLCLSNDLDF